MKKRLIGALIFTATVILTACNTQLELSKDKEVMGKQDQNLTVKNEKAKSGTNKTNNVTAITDYNDKQKPTYEKNEENIEVRKTGNNLSEAINLTFGKFIQSMEISLTEDQNELWFKVKLEKDKNYFFESNGATDNGDPKGYLLNNNEVLKEDNDSSKDQNFRIEHSATEDGIYLLKMELISGDIWVGNFLYGYL